MRIARILAAVLCGVSSFTAALADDSAAQTQAGETVSADAL